MKIDKLFSFIFDRDYFHDRTVVFLLIIFTVVTLINAGLVILGADVDNGIVPVKFNGYGLGRFDYGAGIEQYYFISFVLILYAVTVGLSIKTFNLRKSISAMQLSLSIVVAIMTFFVFNALLT